MSESVYRYKTVVISDLHLGMKDARVRELISFLKEHPARTLIMNGDIVDGWRLRRGGRWKKKHTRFWKYLIQISLHTKIIYLKGNHDDFIGEVAPFGFGNFRVMLDYAVKSGDKKYLVIHGDVFDTITKRLVGLSKFGASGYGMLLAYNRFYNRRRKKKGLPYKSISKEIKRKVKMAANIVGNFEEKAITMARNLGYDGIICGHIHTPSNKMLNGVHYLNSGDWVETMSAITEDFDGNWEIKIYSDESHGMLSHHQPAG